MAEPVEDPGARGTLTVKQRVVERLATRAAMETVGVQHFRRGIDKLTGREFPKADVVVSADHVRASVEIAVEWGRSLATTAAAVQTSVTDALSTMSGLTVDGRRRPRGRRRSGRRRGPPDRAVEADPAP